jgi:hypothetical protein
MLIYIIIFAGLSCVVYKNKDVIEEYLYVNMIKKELKYEEYKIKGMINIEDEWYDIFYESEIKEVKYIK